MEHTGHTTPKMGSEKSFGMVFCVVFLVIGAWPLLSQEAPRLGAIGIAAGFLLLAFLKPGWLAPLNGFWFKFGLLLHRLVSPVLLLLIYLITIVPVGLCMRITKRDPLRLAFDPVAKTYWIERTPPGKPDISMKNQF